MHKLTNKFRKLLLSAVTIGTVGLLAGCGVSASGVEADNSGVTESQSEANGSGQNYAGSDSQKLQIVATIFPEYDWVKEILGEQADNVELTLLLGNGTDMHSFQPTMEDILKVSTCDIFIYVGGESDAWVCAERRRKPEPKGRQSDGGAGRSGERGRNCGGDAGRRWTRPRRRTHP